MYGETFKRGQPELQIKEGTEDKSKIIFLTSQRDPSLEPSQ